MMRILSFRTTSCVLNQLRHSSSSSQVVPQVVAGSMLCSGTSEKDKPQDGPTLEKPKPVSKPKGRLVSAAFDQLKALNVPGDLDDPISKMIDAAKDTEGLLAIVHAKKLTRSHALKLVSVLADWTVEGRVQTSDFEKDPRFAIVCSILGNTPTAPATKPPPPSQTSDLATVLGVTNDDEAAKLISNISLGQMIKVLSMLASKKRRSTPLLRSLAFNISSSTQKLDIKQGADALYAAASLHFHDEMLVDKICSDLCSCLKDNTKRAVVGSIITSLGLLRYKHIDLLNMLSEWVQEHMDVCGPQDLTSLVMTLAVVHHKPTNHEVLFPMVLKQLQASGVPTPQDWLDLVWAQTVLNNQTTEQVSSVLSAEFIDKIKAISTEGLTVPTRLKLLNINGVAKLRLKGYNGPLLDLSAEEWKLPLLRSKEKQTLVASVQETMLNLLPSAVYLGTNVDTGMGYIIDAECLVNAKLAPLPLFDKKTKAPIDRSSPDTPRGIKVAILVLDYHDITRGRRDPTGVNVLFQELTRLKGYRVMTVDYVDFNPRSNLVTRVQHINELLKATIGKS